MMNTSDKIGRSDPGATITFVHEPPSFLKEKAPFAVHVMVKSNGTENTSWKAV